MRSHLPKFGKTAKILYELSKQKGLLSRLSKWETEGIEAFHKTRNLLWNPVTHNAPLDNIEICLETDASEEGFGGALFQIDQKNEKRYILFFRQLAIILLYLLVKV